VAAIPMATFRGTPRALGSRALSNACLIRITRGDREVAVMKEVEVELSVLRARVEALMPKWVNSKSSHFPFSPPQKPTPTTVLKVKPLCLVGEMPEIAHPEPWPCNDAMRE